VTRVEFTVLGEPQPQGSKTVGRGAGGRSFVREDNPQLQPWRERVERAARAAMDGQQVQTGPLRLRAVFVFRRPVGHYGTGRNNGRLRPSAPAYVQTRPDLDKLLRAVGDALTGIVCRDDAQLVDVHAEKHYGETACALVVVEELEPAAPSVSLERSSS
jgi:crossover junction endodeoxyribonuclease RusA